MTRLIKNIQDKHRVEFDKGIFDDWCVYLTRQAQQRFAPRDNQYFGALAILGNTYGHQKIYDDFVKVYNKTNTQIDNSTLALISEIAREYGPHEEEMDIWLSVIYGGMIAEENKSNAILKKRIKRLGMYQVLIEKLPADVAANFSKGKKWRELDTIMRERGF